MKYELKGEFIKEYELPKGVIKAYVHDNGLWETCYALLEDNVTVSKFESLSFLETYIEVKREFQRKEIEKSKHNHSVIFYTIATVLGFVAFGVLGLTVAIILILTLVLKIGLNK